VENVYLSMDESQKHYASWCSGALRRLRLEDHEFKDSLGYIVSPCLKKKFLIAKQKITHDFIVFI
jgi:hypothetical protein